VVERGHKLLPIRTFEESLEVREDPSVLRAEVTEDSSANLQRVEEDRLIHLQSAVEVFLVDSMV
jgi:hypothetical protein